MKSFSHISTERYIFLARIYSRPAAAAGVSTGDTEYFFHFIVGTFSERKLHRTALNCEAVLTAHDPRPAAYDALGTDLMLVSMEEGAVSTTPNSEFSASQAAVAHGPHDQDQTAEPGMQICPSVYLPHATFSTQGCRPCVLREDDPVGETNTSLP